jgi:PAS domain S-box-containing protein
MILRQNERIADAAASNESSSLVRAGVAVTEGRPIGVAQGDVELLERSPLAMGVVENLGLVYANVRLLELLGISRERAQGASVFDFIAKEEHGRVLERHVLRARGEIVPDCYDVTIVRADGTLRFGEIFIGRGGQGERVVFQVVDHTERRERSKSLHALARLGASLQASRVGQPVNTALVDGLTSLGVAWVRLRSDADGLAIEQMSLPAEAIAAFEAVRGAPVVGALGQWLPELLEAWTDGVAHIDDLPLATARFFADASAREAADIMRRWGLLRAVAVRIDNAGQPSGLMLLVAPWIASQDLPAYSLFGTQVSAALDAERIICDLSDRNAELAALNRIASDAGTERDLGSLFASAAEEVTRVLGCASVAMYLVEDARGTPRLAFRHFSSDSSRELFGAESGEGSLEFAREMIALGAPRLVSRAERPVGAAAGDFLAAAVSLAVVPLVARSAITGLLVGLFMRPATDRDLKLLEATAAHLAASVNAKQLFDHLRSSYATLARTQRQLVHRERLAAIGELAATVAHEVRNPLGVIFNSVGALRRVAGKSEQMGTLVAILDEEAHRINHIVGDLLDFARPTLPALETEALAAVLDAATEAALGGVREGIEVERRYDPASPLVRIDARLMRQALVNVVSNALQAMPHGGRLGLSIGPDGGGVKVGVSDTGVGIAPDARERIFEPFYTTRATGTGLGLAVVKRIVDGHRGEISFDSSQGIGTTFTIRLPRDPDDAQSVDSARFG